MTMISWIVAVLTATQVVQGMVPDIGATGAAEVESTDPTRSLLGRRELLVKRGCSGMWGQCGGKKWSGSTCCSVGSCVKKNDYYSQCKMSGGGGRGSTRTQVAQPIASIQKSQVKQESGPSPPPPPPPPESSNGGGKFSICISGSSETFGPTVSQREFKKQGSAVTITSSGSCSWEEYAGGFDGYPSPEVGDGHEEGMDMAIEQMFPGNRSKQNDFLRAMIAIAKPINLEHPRDEGRANDGERMRNINKLNKACSELITNSC